MNNSLNRNLFCLFVLLLVCACARNNLDPVLRAHLEKPDWISGESYRYPSHLYLTGHGVSADLNLAKKQSSGDLAGNLDSEIKTYLKQRAPSIDEVATTAAQGFALDEKSWEQVLQSRQIAETWQDPSSKAFHVLTVIDRVTTGEDVLNQIYRLDEQVQRTMDKAKQEPDLLQRIAFAKHAIEKQQRRQQLQFVVGVLKPVAISASSSWSEQQIREQINTWLAELTIIPVAEQNQPEIVQAMRAGIENAGFKMGAGAKPDYILKATFRQGEVKWKDGVYSLQGDLNLEFMDGEWKGQVRGSASWPIEVTSTDREQLSEQLTNAIREASEEKIKDTLMGLETN